VARTSGAERIPAAVASSLGDCACFNARSAARAITDLYDQTLAPSRLRATQFAILAAIHLQAGGAMQTVASELGLDPSTMTRVLRPLEEGGLVTVETGAGGRAKQVELTSLGRKKLAEAHRLWEKAQERLREKLGDRVFERVVKDLGAVQRALAK